MHIYKVDDFLDAWRSASMPISEPNGYSGKIWKNQRPEHLNSLLHKYRTALSQGECDIMTGYCGLGFKTREDVRGLAQDYWNLIWSLQDALNNIEIESQLLFLVARQA